MTSWIKYIFQPLAYLKITYEKGTKSKLFLDIYAPFILCIVLYIMSYVANGRLPVLHNDTISEIISFLTFAFPFYVASLTAVSTFPNDELDKQLKGDDSKQAILKEWDNDEQRFKHNNLSRRRLVAFTFGYLSVVSLSLIITLVFEQHFAVSNLLQKAPTITLFVISNFVNFIFWVILLNLVFVTLFALRFLIYSVVPRKAKLDDTD